MNIHDIVYMCVQHISCAHPVVSQNRVNFRSQRVKTISTYVVFIVYTFSSIFYSDVPNIWYLRIDNDDALTTGNQRHGDMIETPKTARLIFWFYPLKDVGRVIIVFVCRDHILYKSSDRFSITVAWEGSGRPPCFTRAARVAYEFRQIEQITLYCTAHVHRTRVYYNGWNRLWCTPPPDVPDGREEFRSVMIRRIEIRFVRQVLYTHIDIFLHGVNDCSATWKSSLCVQCSI